MILMLTLFYPAEMQKKIMETSAGLKPPAYVKKWQIYGATDGPQGYKAIHIVYIEKGKADEALVDIPKLFLPTMALGRVEIKFEILWSLRDIAAVYLQ